MITEDQAKIRFKRYLISPCPVCEKGVGELCNSPGVWVHAERMELATIFFTQGATMFENKLSAGVWADLAESTPDVFSRPRIAPQGEDGTAHFNYYDRERALSFQWDGHYEQNVTVSQGGYGEPVKWTFDFLEFWKIGVATHLIGDTPRLSQPNGMHHAAYQFQCACNNWIKWMEEDKERTS